MNLLQILATCRIPFWVLEGTEGEFTARLEGDKTTARRGPEFSMKLLQHDVTMTKIGTDYWGAYLKMRQNSSGGQ